MVSNVDASVSIHPIRVTTTTKYGVKIPVVANVINT